MRADLESNHELSMPIECPEDPAWCDCAWHENMLRAEESHHVGDGIEARGAVQGSTGCALQGDQLAFTEIPPPPPPEAYLVAQLKEAHTILSRLSVSFDRKLPQNVYLAMSYLHIEIATRTPVSGGVR